MEQRMSDGKALSMASGGKRYLGYQLNRYTLDKSPVNRKRAGSSSPDGKKLERGEVQGVPEWGS